MACECGCGRPTPIVQETDTRRGRIKGQPSRFLLGHGGIAQWKGGRRRMGVYVVTRMVGHPRAQKHGHYVLEHLLVAEAALGHYIPEPAQVHHRDRDGSHNKPSNLIVCEDQDYHHFIHLREDVYRAGGNPRTQRLCRRHGLLPLSKFYEPSGKYGQKRGQCRLCANEYSAAGKQRKKKARAA